MNSFFLNKIYFIGSKIYILLLDCLSSSCFPHFFFSSAHQYIYVHIHHLTCPFTHSPIPISPSASSNQPIPISPSTTFIQSTHPPQPSPCVPRGVGVGGTHAVRVHAHGTTTLAFAYAGGIVVAVDSRASMGTAIGAHSRGESTRIGGESSLSSFFSPFSL